MSKKKLFLIDAYALIFRAYYAFLKNPVVNSKGFETSAILGFFNSIFDIIRREKPDYLSVVFDKGGRKERKNLMVKALVVKLTYIHMKKVKEIKVY